MVQENLTGVRVVRAFGREIYEIGKFNEKNDGFSNLWIKLGRVLSLFWASGTLLTSSQVFVTIIAGVVEAVNGGLTLGEFLVFVSYSSSLAWPIRSLGRVLAEMSKAGVSIDRVGYILNSEPENGRGNELCPPMTGDIEFKHVTFGYEGSEVLHDVSFTIPAGTTFAILGGTGSGKSTLVHLLDRLYDLGEGQGEISVGGVDIRDIDRGYLRRHIGLVLQEPFLFSRTIAENISAARPGAEEADIRRAAGIACVDEAITEFADGYGTMVGERGVTLSGGQKQRVAIAQDAHSRARPSWPSTTRSPPWTRRRTPKYAPRSRESLGARDGDTHLAPDHDAHAGASASSCSPRGSVADIGTHEELISRPGIYREIYDIQMSSDDRQAASGKEAAAHAGI